MNKLLIIIMVFLVLVGMIGCQTNNQESFTRSPISDISKTKETQQTNTPVVSSPTADLTTSNTMASAAPSVADTTQPINTPDKTDTPSISNTKSPTAEPSKSTLNTTPPTIQPDDRVVVPNVVGQNEGKALELMKKAGVTVRVVYEFHDRHDKGYVYDQEYPAGYKINPEVSIFIWVSKGLINPIVPNVIGMEYTKAKNKLLSVCDTWNINIAREFSNSPKDTVIKMNVEVGGGYSRNSNIWLYVSDGPEVFIEVPNVVGENYQTAKSMIEKLGLRVRLEFTSSNSAEKDKVINQSPSGGRRISERSKDSVTVTLVVSTGPKPETESP